MGNNVEIPKEIIPILGKYPEGMKSPSYKSKYF